MADVKHFNATHGLSDSKIYKVWNTMRLRCVNPSQQSYPLYGGRGVTVCDRWMRSFDAFYEDMGPTYKEGLSLDRIDNNADYTPENCRWATKTEQARNTRNIERALKYTYKGVTKTTREWAEMFGIKRTTLDMRLRHRGIPIEQALTGKRG